MSEYHEDGLTKPERYNIDRHQVNREFDKKLENKSFFTSKKTIQAEREAALKKVHDDHWGGGGGYGGFCD